MTVVLEPGTHNALSMHHPWALAVAAGVKAVETRGYPPPRSAVGLPLVICSTSHRWERCGEGTIGEWWWQIDSHGAMMRNDMPTPEAMALPVHWAPHGKALAVCTLMGFQPTEDFVLNAPSHVLDAEYEWGNYEPGRWAWLFSDVRRIVPVRVRGRQKVWWWTTADPVVEYVETEEAWART